MKTQCPKTECSLVPFKVVFAQGKCLKKLSIDENILKYVRWKKDNWKILPILKI